MGGVGAFTWSWGGEAGGGCIALAFIDRRKRQKKNESDSTVW